MKNRLIKLAVRLMFTVTSRHRALRQVHRNRSAYLKLAEALDPATGARCMRVPPMPGVDEDMRDWSFFMILEHNTLVSRSISAIVAQLAQGERLSGAATIDPKTGVMPSPSAGIEQVTRFRTAIADHLTTVAGLGKLRGTRTARHPLFREFDAHKWNCMFAFHLKIHVAQARYVVRSAKKRGG
jgi:hypothetical protein